MLNFDSFVVEDENSIALSNFVKRIVKLSLKLDNFTVKVLDSTRASSSFAAHGIRLTQEYVVTINADGIGEHCAKLAKFTNHAVKAISPSTIFWEEGERIATEGDNSSGVVEEHQSKELSNTNSNVCFRKSKTVLPHWLDKRFSMNIKLFMLQSMSVMSIILISTKKNLKFILVLTFLAVMQRCFVLLIIFCRINA